MKKGCLFVLVVFALAFAGYYKLFLGTELESKYWIPGLLAVAAAALVGNIQGIFMAIGKVRAANRPRMEWRDGDLIGVSGQVRSGSPIKAPFSGTDAVIVEYNLRRIIQHDNSTGHVDDITGFMMAPCEVQSRHGAVKLVGFPILTQLTSMSNNMPDAIERAANFLARANFKEQSSNPIAAIKELNQVLTDDDGVVQADFCKKGVLSNLEGFAPEDESSESASVSNSPVAKDGLNHRVAQFRNLIQDMNYRLNETIIANGVEVTAFGTFSKDKNAINIGSGLQNLSHSLQLGAASKVISKAIRSAIIGTIFWVAVVGAANYYVLGLIGIDLKQYLSALNL